MRRWRDGSGVGGVSGVGGANFQRLTITFQLTHKQKARLPKQAGLSCEWAVLKTARYYSELPVTAATTVAAASAMEATTASAATVEATTTTATMVAAAATTESTACAAAAESTASAAAKAAAADWTTRRAAGVSATAAANESAATAACISATRVGAVSAISATIAVAAAIAVTAAVPISAAPAVSTPPAVPRSGADKDAAHKPVRTVIAIGRASVRVVGVIAPGAFGWAVVTVVVTVIRSGHNRRANTDSYRDLAIRLRYNGEWQNHKHCYHN